MEPRPHTRDALADLLWPKVPQGEGRHSLATAMSGLRGKLGKESFEATADRIRLRPGVVALDVDRLLKGEVLGTEFEERLDVDGFLQAFELPDAPPFSHWRDGEHARLLPNVRDALVILIDHCRRTGDFRQIETLALRLLRFDSLSEEGIRARMEARAFAGDRLTALRLFKDWKVALSRRLGAAPSPLLEGMALRLRRREWERPEAPDVPAVRTDQWRGRPFVGRGREYRELYEAWEGTQRGAPRHRLLLGDSGIGKSTLVERLTTAAGLEGATVARVQCHEVEREIPYAMVSGLIAQLVERPGSSAAPPDALAELAQTIPAVRQRFPVLPPPLESQGDAARIRFTEATHALMAAVAEEHPVIIVVDDVHHADDVSLAVLHRVVRLADRQAILMIFLARPGELHQSPQAARLRDNGASLGIHPMELHPLDADDGRALLDLLLVELQLNPSATVRRALLAAAAGFPLVLELLVRDWGRSGQQCLALSLDAVTTDAGRKSEPDEAYQLLLDRLVRTLDPGTRNTLHVAAVLGPRLNDSALYALADLKVSDVMTGLTMLAQYRILRDGGDHLEFANDLVRAHAYYGVPVPMRRLLHGRIADALLERAAKGDDSLGLEIAWHCMRCGRKEEATKHLLLGARASIRGGAVHEAEQRLGSAMRFLSGSDLKEAALLLAELLQEQSRWAESLEVLEGYAEALHSLEGTALAAIARANVSFDPFELAPLADQTCRVLSAGAADARTTGAFLRLGAYLVARLRDSELSLKILQAHVGLEEAVRAWDADEQLQWRTVRVFLSHRAGGVLFSNEEMYEELTALAQLTQAYQSPNKRSVRLVSGLGMCLSKMARYEEAVATFQRGSALAQQLGDYEGMANLLTSTSLAHYYLGQYGNQLQLAELGAKHIIGPFGGLTEINNTFLLASGFLLQGDRGAADTVVRARLSQSSVRPTTVVSSSVATLSSRSCAHRRTA